MAVVRLSRGARNVIPDGEYSASGRPSDSLGSNGDHYYRTDKGWTYTKTGGTWVLTDVPTTQANPFDDILYYIDEYISLQYQPGDLQLNGNANTTTNTLTDYHNGTFLALGYDGNPNFARPDDPVEGSPKKAMMLRCHYLDTATSSSDPDTVRSMVRTKDVNDVPGVVDADVDFDTGTTYTFTISMCFDQTLLDAFATTAGSTGNVMWQMHASAGSGSPPMAMRLYGGGDSPTLGESTPYAAPTLTFLCLTANADGSGGTITLNKTLISNPSADTWYDFVVHFKMSYSGSTYLKVWVAERGSAYVQKISSPTGQQFGYNSLTTGYYATFGHYFKRASWPNFGASPDVETVTAHFKNVVYSEAGATEPNSTELDDLFNYLALR